MPVTPKEELEKEKTAPAPRKLAFAELSLWQLSTIIYTLMAALGCLIAIYGHGTLQQALAVPQSGALALRLGGIAGLSTGILLIAGFLFEGWFPSYQFIKESIMTILGPTSVVMALYLAFVSAVGEELFFRAGILPYAGLFVTSILFGLLHLGPDGRISAWSVWALLAGFLLGWTYEATTSLWPAILAHFTVNAFSIIRLQREFRARLRSLEDHSPLGE